MAHRTDPDRRYIDAGIARLEAVAAAASAAAGLTFMVLVAVGITIARHLLW